MKFMKKRLVAVILVVAMLSLFVAACGNGEAGRDAPIDFVIYSQLANFSGLMTGWSAEIMREKFNVNVIIINDGIDGTFQTRMEAGFLGDIVIFGNDGDDYRDASDAGMLFDWLEDDLLWTYGPDIADHFMNALNRNKAITGTLHGFGHGVAGSAEDHEEFFYYPHIRFDLFSQLGYPSINTLEDFIPVLYDMVRLEPVSSVGTPTFGVSSFPDWDGDMVMMVKSTAALYGWEEFHIGLFCTQTWEWQGALDPDGWYLRALRFYNRLFQLGLFDPDSMTQTWDDLREKYQNGVAMFNIFSWIADHFNTDEHLTQGKMMRPVLAADQMNLVHGLSVYGGSRVWSIGANSNFPELAMEIINWLSTPEGVLAYNHGPRGITWDVDDDGEAFLTALGLATKEDSSTIITYGDWTGEYRLGEFQHNNTTWALDSVNPDSPSGLTFNHVFWPSTELMREVSDIEQAWRDWSGFVLEDDFIKNNGYSVFINSQYSANRQSRELRTIWEQVTLTIKEGSWRAIYAQSDEEFEAIVAQMTADAYAFGYQQCVDWILIEVDRLREAKRATLGE